MKPSPWLPAPRTAVSLLPALSEREVERRIRLFYVRSARPILPDFLSLLCLPDWGGNWLPHTGDEDTPPLPKPGIFFFFEVFLKALIQNLKVTQNVLLGFIRFSTMAVKHGCPFSPNGRGFGMGLLMFFPVIVLKTPWPDCGGLLPD
jgi:hypothetical protein